MLSDVLPYEVPLTFTNRNFYDFLREHRVECKDDSVTWKASTPTVDTIIRILFAFSDDPAHLTTISRYIGGKNTSFKSYNLYPKKTANGKLPFPIGLIPFGFKIDHKQNEFRELSIPHPRNQLEMVDFYDTCKETLLYFCSISPFSIRRPAKLAHYVYHKDHTHYDHLADDEAIIEQDDLEYEHLKSFFVYRNYSNVHKFYESYRYHRCEKKYSAMLQLDISKCFDSIYTHSVVWAILGKEAVKQNLKASKNSFSGRFDTLMQRMNYNETNGILIGPEFSRIFAELILQSIDKNVRQTLARAPYTLRHKVDYEAFRYVDDYFIFFNDAQHKDAIVKELQHSLKEYGLYLNNAKATLYEKPIITEISRAKRRIVDLLEEKLVYEHEELSEVGDDGTLKNVIKGSIHVNSSALIIEFKTILRECDVEYKDLLNYSLSVTENKVDKILKRYSKADRKHRCPKTLSDAVIAILEFVFFIYSVSPRVNTTVKLCRILRMVCAFFRAKTVLHDHKHLVFKYIFDDLVLILRKNRNDKHTQVETLYLLIALTELGKEYSLEEDVLAGYLNIEKDISSGHFLDNAALNYFSLTVALFYMRNKRRYSSLRMCVEQSILAKMRVRSTTCRQETELTLLLLDAIASPYVSQSIKYAILEQYGVKDRGLQNDIINYKRNGRSRQQWFTTWHDFDFGKELDRKRGYEVY